MMISVFGASFGKWLGYAGVNGHANLGHQLRDRRKTNGKPPFVRRGQKGSEEPLMRSDETLNARGSWVAATKLVRAEARQAVP
jgi:hypothetical protein